MSSLVVSTHARERMAQRGFRDMDLIILETFGTPTKDGMILLDRDARRVAERALRLAGSFAVINGDTVVTMYRPGKKRAKRLIRESRLSRRS